MGIVFFIGEFAGGLLLSLDQKAAPARSQLQKVTTPEEESYGNEA